VESMVIDPRTVKVTSTINANDLMDDTGNDPLLSL